MALEGTYKYSGRRTLRGIDHSIVQDYRPVQPRNSVRGLHYCAMGATCTQASTPLVLLVLMMLTLRPQVQVYMHGRLETRD